MHNKKYKGFPPLKFYLFSTTLSLMASRYKIVARGDLNLVNLERTIRYFRRLQLRHYNILKWIKRPLLNLHSK